MAGDLLTKVARLSAFLANSNVRNWAQNCRAACGAECPELREKRKRSWSPFRAVH